MYGDALCPANVAACALAPPPGMAREQPLCKASSPDRDQGCSQCSLRRSLALEVSARPLEWRVGVLNGSVEAGLEPGTGDRRVGHGPGRQVVIQRVAAERRIAHAVEALACGVIGTRRNQRARAVGFAGRLDPHIRVKAGSRVGDRTSADATGLVAPVAPTNTPVDPRRVDERIQVRRGARPTGPARTTPTVA